MNRTLTGVVLAVAAVVVIGGGLFILNKDDEMSDMPKTGSTSATSNENAMKETNAVEIKDFDFGPHTISVKVGTKVTWTNQDSAHHDITPDSESADFMPSELLAKGESYSFTFNKAGSYAYHCSPHPYMKATVEVTE